MDDKDWYARLSVSRSHQFATNEECRKRKADAYWTWLMMRRAARTDVYKFNISFNREYMESFGSPLYRGKQQLSEEERTVVDAYKTEGQSALKGDQLATGTSAFVPSSGWVSCIVCDGVMPANKVEFTKPMPSRDLYVFYHATCFDSTIARQSEHVYKRIPAPPTSNEGDEARETVTNHVVDWDLDKPSDGDDN
eukprot:jgi/Mesvir1/21654/Mv04075-RA.1